MAPAVLHTLALQSPPTSRSDSVTPPASDPTAAPASASVETPVPDDGAVDDNRLMAAFAGGESAAFEVLYSRHQAGLYRFVRRLLGVALAAQADEVFQDTWMRVLQGRGQWQADGAANFRTWLYTLAHHRAVDVLRRSGREISIEASAHGDEAPYEPGADAWAAWPAPDAPSADDQVFWRTAGQRLLDCLEQLPSTQRAAFLLHHEEGHTLDQIAKALDLGFETLKSRLRYALVKLRTCMGAYLPP